MSTVAVVPIAVLLLAAFAAIMRFDRQRGKGAGFETFDSDLLAGFGQLSPQDAADLEVYLEQFDNGLAPAVHFARLLDSETAGSGVELQMRSTLLKQAHRGWLGVVAFGTTAIEGTPRELRWTYRPASGSFQADDPLVPPMTLGEFAMAAESGLASNVFMGVPPGNETRIGIDLDADGLPNGLEQAQGTDPFRADTDGDGWPDGYEAENGGSPLTLISPKWATGPGCTGSTSLAVAFV